MALDINACYHICLYLTITGPKKCDNKNEICPFPSQTQDSPLEAGRRSIGAGCSAVTSVHRKSRACSHGENRLTIGDGWTKTWTYFKNDWHQGNIGIMGPRTHAAWLCSVVFDGARAFEGVTPDLEVHCARINDSAKKLFLKPIVTTETWVNLAREGIKRFDKDAALYIRPMYWGEKEGPWVQAHDPESTQWCLSIYEAPMRTPKGFSITLSPYRRPTLETMPVDAKAGCLYPNNSRSLFEAQSRGFDNAIVCDMLGNVAELATSNVFMAKDESCLLRFRTEHSWRALLGKG